MERIREYSGIIGQILYWTYPDLIREFPKIRTMGDVLNDVLNADPMNTVKVRTVMDFIVKRTIMRMSMIQI